MTSKIHPLEHQIWSNRDSYRRLEDRLRADLRRLVPHPEKTYVSFSAGKDSTVLAHACHDLFPGVQMCMVDPGVPFHWVDEERDLWLTHARANGWNLRIFPWDKWGGILRDDKTRRVAQRLLHTDMFAEVTEWVHKHGLDTVVMGLRRQESGQRSMALKIYGMEHTYADTGVRRVCPLEHWSTSDVWAYIVSHGLPWLTIYDHVGPDARNGLIGRNAAQSGRMAYLRQYYPEAWRIARDVLSLEYARWT